MQEEATVEEDPHKNYKGFATTLHFSTLNKENLCEEGRSMTPLQ